MIPPFLLLKENFLSSKFCDYSIKFFELNDRLHRPGMAGSGVDDISLIDTELKLNFSNQESLSKKLWEYLDKLLMEYVELNPCLNKIGHWEIHDTFQIQKYNPGEGYFGEHCEHGSSSLGKKISDRVMSWIVYLNDVDDGGETRFPQYDFNVKSKKGSIIIFPAGWTHMHHGIVSNTQSKYLITGWCCYV